MILLFLIHCSIGFLLTNQKAAGQFLYLHILDQLKGYRRHFYSSIIKYLVLMRLIEFENSRGITLRAVAILVPESSSKTAVVCVSGFEGLSTTAPKFVQLTKILLTVSAIPVGSIFRYDPTGIGLSDGDYHSTTIDTLIDDLSNMIKYVRQYSSNIIFIGHSLGGCIISQFLKSNDEDLTIEKIILLAPALNQYELHRYWYMQGMNSLLTWSEFKNTFNEADFQAYLDSKPMNACKSQRAHRIDYDFIRQCSKHDFSSALDNYQNCVLHIHGNQDPVVPMGSIKSSFQNTFIMNTDDHDLEKPDIMDSWIEKAIEFIVKS